MRTIAHEVGRGRVCKVSALAASCRAVVWLSFVLSVAGCQKSLRGGRCACTTGWVCCEAVNLCVRNGEACPLPDGGLVSGSDAQPSDVKDGPTDAVADLTVEARSDAPTDLAAEATSLGERPDAEVEHPDGPDRADAAPTRSFPPVCTTTSWCWVLPRPAGESFVALSVQGPDDVWVGGQGGNILHLDRRSGKESWSSYALPSDDLAAMWGTSSDDMWFGGFEGVWHWTGIGMFKQLNPSTPYHQRAVKAIWGASANEVWVAGYGMQRFVGGISAESPRTDSLTGEILALWGSGPTQVFAGVVGPVSGGILQWDGLVWTKVDDLPARHLAGRGPRDVWAASTEAIEHYGTKGWELPDKPPLSQPIAWVSTDSAVGALGEDGILSWWEGANPVWRPATDMKAPPGRFTVLAASSKKDVWAAGAGGALAHWDGSTWTPTLPGPVLTTSAITQLAGAGLSDLWAIAGTTLLRGQGDQWEIAADASRFGGQIKGIWSTTSNELWLVGGDNRLHHWDGQWLPPNDVPIMDANTEQLGAITGTAADDLWVLRGDRVLHYDGKWKSVTPTLQPMTRLLSVARNEAWFGGQGLVHYKDGVVTSARFDSEAGEVTALGGSSPTDVWVAFGKNVYRYFAETDRWRPMVSFDSTVISFARVPGGDVWAILVGSGRSLLRHGLDEPGTLERAPATLQSLYAAPDGSLWSGGEAGALLRHK